MTQDSTRYNLLAAFHFNVTIEGSKGRSWTVGFSEVSGIGTELQTEDITEGGMNGYVIRLPKPPRYRNLVLKRALSGGKVPEFVDWARRAVNDFEIQTRTVLVSLINENGDPVRSWRFLEAYPVKLSYSDLGASKNELVIETMELAYMSQTEVREE